MPSEKQVWLAADEVHRTGERVTQDRVIAALQKRGRGGSTRQVGPHLLSWKVARNYRPRLEVKGLPERLQGELVGFVERVWEAALVEASLRYEDDRLKVEIEGRAARELIDEAFMKTEIAVRENEALKSRMAVMEIEMAALRKEASDLVAEEFWDRVMREIEGVLPENGWVADHQVLKLLPPSLAREAISRARPLTRGKLNAKMGIRVTHKKYFESEEREDGFTWYRRRAG
jgi:hypothetical protein